MSKILIVDDSAELLEVLKYFLEEKGYEAETARGYDELITSIRTFEPDLVILDIFLKGEDGREICRELRKLNEIKYICVLLFSSSANALQQYREYGADDFIEKPFGLREITEKIESTLATCRDYQPSGSN